MAFGSDADPAGDVLEPDAPERSRRHVRWNAVAGAVVLAYVVVLSVALVGIGDRNRFNRWAGWVHSLGGRIVISLVVLAAAVEFDEFVAATMPAPRPPPITSPPRSAAQGTQRRLFRPCFASFISVTWESSLRYRAPVLSVRGAAVITPAGWRRPPPVPRAPRSPPPGEAAGGWRRPAC